MDEDAQMRIDEQMDGRTDEVAQMRTDDGWRDAKDFVRQSKSSLCPADFDSTRKINVNYFALQIDE